jgi:hypothetical protein
MKKFDVEIKRSSSGRETLPAGGYVCQIVSAKVESNDWGDVLIIAHDVCEGDYSGIFKRDYDNNTNENKKWRGTFRVRLPKDDGSEKDEWNKRSLGNTIWAIEDSNPGFTFDWDEKKLKGKKIGLLYRNKEWEYNGNTGWTTEAIAAESIDNIRDGKYKTPKDKPLANKPTTAFANAIEESDGELPF